MNMNQHLWTRFVFVKGCAHTTKIRSAFYLFFSVSLSPFFSVFTSSSYSQLLFSFVFRCRIMHISPERKININLCNASPNNEMIYPHKNTKYTHSPACTNQMIEMKKKKQAEIIQISCCVLTDNYVVCSCIYLLFDRRCDELECDESKKRRSHWRCVYVYSCVYVNDSSCSNHTHNHFKKKKKKKTHEMITFCFCGRLCESEIVK